MKTQKLIFGIMFILFGFFWIRGSQTIFTTPGRWDFYTKS